MALRQAPGAPAPHEANGVMHEPEENEDEKVYYGFGVFMGLPLADLKAMKEDFMHKQSHGLANGDYRGSALPPSTSTSLGNGGNARSAGIDYNAPPSAGGHEYNGRGGMGGRMHGGAPPDGLGNGRVHTMPPPHAGQAHYGGAVRAPPRALGREYDASHGDDVEDEAALSDEGSDGSYSAPKSHSLNFILH